MAPGSSTDLGDFDDLFVEEDVDVFAGGTVVSETVSETVSAPDEETGPHDAVPDVDVSGGGSGAPLGDDFVPARRQRPPSSLWGMIPPKPDDRRVRLLWWEWLTLFVCNLVTTVGIGGDIARHVTDAESLNEPFLAGWHLVLYGGVTLGGLWLGVGAIRRGPDFLWKVPTVCVGFGILAFAGAADSLWHAIIGTEAEFEALVSPPHLLVMVGLLYLLASPISILWRTPGRLSPGKSFIVVTAAVSTLLVAMMFTGYATTIASGMDFDRGTAGSGLPDWLESTELETAEPGAVDPGPVDLGSPAEVDLGPGGGQAPSVGFSDVIGDSSDGSVSDPSVVTSWIVGESDEDLAVALGMATVVWTSVLFATTWSAMFLRFRLSFGPIVVTMTVVAATTATVTRSIPTAIGLLAMGVVAELCVAAMDSTGRFTQPVVAMSATAGAVGSFWFAQFIALGDERTWSAPLWTGAVVIAALIAVSITHMLCLRTSPVPQSSAV